jgi:hypothetical protein
MVEILLRAFAGVQRGRHACMAVIHEGLTHAMPMANHRSLQPEAQRRLTGVRGGYIFTICSLLADRQATRERAWRRDGLMLDQQTLPVPGESPTVAPEPTELPLTVVPDWDMQVQRADRLARLIDRHLDYEAYGRRLLAAEALTPMALCPEQRVSLLTDVRAQAS